LSIRTFTVAPAAAVTIHPCFLRTASLAPSITSATAAVNLRTI
jgi:hypothetical protein